VLTVPSSVRIFLALGPTDMRKSFDTLARLVEEVIGEDPLSGHLFVFCNRKRNRLKILVWDRSGFWLHAKRLEEGRFAWPGRMADEETSIEMDARELSLLIGGIDLRHVRRRNWYDRTLLPGKNSKHKKIRLHA